MEEVFKHFDPPWEGYQISNFGRVISPRGKVLNPIAMYHGGNYNVKCILKKVVNGKERRQNANVAVEVYRYFGEGYVNRAIVRHKDGDKFNNRIDNLFIARAYTTKPSREQEARIPEILPCVRSAVYKSGVMQYRREGMDVDNIIGEAAFMCWKYLASYNAQTNFYGFCKKYARLAFLQEYKKFKRYRNEIRLDDLRGV